MKISLLVSPKSRHRRAATERNIIIEEWIAVRANAIQNWPKTRLVCFRQAFAASLRLQMNQRSRGIKNVPMAFFKHSQAKIDVTRDAK